MSDSTDIIPINRTNKNENLIIFLRTLADSLESKTLEDNKIQLVGEFYMKYQFHDFSTDNTVEKINEEDLKTFIFLGWFIYCFILKDPRFKKMLHNN